MRLIVLTGTSGAGKTTALHFFEDAGYYAADNLPPHLLEALVRTCASMNRQRVAAVVDSRSGPCLADLPAALDALAASGTQVQLLFVDASDEILVRRFKECRRPHPTFQAGRGTILEAVRAEREMLAEALERCDKLIDTSHLTPAGLRAELSATVREPLGRGLIVTIESFGFKHGTPIDADLVFDVRFLVNPHYDPRLKDLTGSSQEVAEFIHADALTTQYLQRLGDFLLFTLPEYEREGKAYLTIAIGCTGGRHRSVTIAEDIARRLEQAGYYVAVLHRDVDRERPSDEASP